MGSWLFGWMDTINCCCAINVYAGVCVYTESIVSSQGEDLPPYGLEKKRKKRHHDDVLSSSSSSSYAEEISPPDVGFGIYIYI